MKKNTRHLLKALLSVLAITMLFCMPASAASKKTVATIGGKSYTSMASAVKAVKNGQTIKLQKDTKIKSALNRNKKYTIDLNGHKLTGTYAIKDTRIKKENVIRVSAGTVTLKNGAVTGLYVNNGAELIVSNLIADRSYFLYIKEDAKVKLKSGSMDSLSIYNYGTLTINKMTIKKFRLTNESSGKATIKGGTFSNNSYNGIQNSGKLTISGGTFSKGANSKYSYSIRNTGKTGKLTISGGTFKNTLIYNNSSGDMTISNGEFTNKEYSYLLNVLGGQVTIKGGTFKSTSYDTVFKNEGGTLKITGGTIKSTGTAENLKHASMGTIFCGKDSKTIITGGTISNKYSNGIYVKKSAGSFECSGAKISVSSSEMEKICYQ